MRPGHTLLLLAISSALLTLASPAAALDVGSHHKHHLPPVDPRIVPFCNQTFHPEICINSARLYAAKFPVIDATNVFNMLIEALQDRIRIVTARTKAMSKSQTSEDVLTCIKSCLEYYNDAMDSTKEGVDAFVARDVGTFITRLSSAITMISTCNDGFVDFSIPNPLEEQNDRLMNMAGNCIAVGKLNFKDVY
ncbi:putative pectinesterase/pectinesterase inhibitor 58 [Cocos nucifera]|uniref:Putative pectinesterase/pectinesterase inhibitor 58 n=1 Tax=Cocos nucifera TaxID=13894 RepID=A0A8K0N1R4_COCNU|nr:putative pectinesterase/pectinesterase inhibitor 58 [Cocos nucifera]